MKLLARDIMSTTPTTTTPDAEIREAARSMGLHRVSCLPVVDDEEILGILSATDVVFTRWGPGDPGTVREVMSPATVSCAPDTSVDRVAVIMHEHMIHHVLVIANGRLVGVISAHDLISPLLESWSVLRGLREL